MEHQEFNAEEESRNHEYSLFKKSLLSGSLSFDELIDKLFALDQSTPARDASENNLRLMKDPEVVDWVNSHPEILDSYYVFLSLTEFHVGQRLAVAGSDETLDHFKEALRFASFDSGGESWAAYVEGTILYMQAEQIPEALIIKAEQEGRNGQILRNFNKGLAKRGFASYLEDYSNKTV